MVEGLQAVKGVTFHRGLKIKHMDNRNGYRHFFLRNAGTMTEAGGCDRYKRGTWENEELEF